MAKGNMFLGMSRGSVGDVTFYRGRGQQIARARNRNPKNPRSEAQTIQRMILTTASKAYSRLKAITDHSFQGVSYGADSQSYFLKRAMEDIRNWVALNLPTTPDSVYSDPLGVVGLAYPTNAASAGVGLLISQGTIPSVPAVTATPEGEGAVPSFDHFGSLASETIASVLDALGAQPGDQITGVGLNLSRGVVYYCRYVINSDATTASLNEEWDGSIDSAAFDQEKSMMSREIVINVATGGKIRVEPVAVTGIEVFDAVAIIISRKVGDVWQRSTQRLVWTQEAVDLGDFPESVLPEWLAGSAGIDTASPYYLNNADL